MNKRIAGYQRKVLKALGHRMDNFYLAGGTALSLFYFQHRVSIDLDFFTRNFVYSDIAKLIAYLEDALKKKAKLLAQNLSEETAKIVVYNISFTPQDTLKIDFVEDTVSLLKDTKMVDGIHILSLEDIYLRKLYALAGMIKIADEAGRDEFIGGRSDAKDFYDVYFLSNTFITLSKFMPKYCDHIVTEGIIRWYRTFDRMRMMDGILELITNRPADFKIIEGHFKKEVDKIIEHEIGPL